MPLARSLARRYRRGPEPLEDLEQVASLALLKAVEGFDPSRDLAFSSYAVPSIAGALKRHYRDCGWSVRVPRDLQELALRVERFNEDAWATTGAAPTAARDRRARGRQRRGGGRGARGASGDARRLARPAAALGRGRRGRVAARHAEHPRRGLPARLRPRRARRAARDARRARPDDRAALLPRGAHPVRDRRAARPVADARLAAAAPGHRAAGRRRGPGSPPRPEALSCARGRRARAGARCRRRSRRAPPARASRGGRG